MPVEHAFSRAFLTRWETRQLVAYIPRRSRNFTGRNRIEDCGEVLGASGVTVGTGLDLGQHSVVVLRRMRVTESLINYA